MPRKPRLRLPTPLGSSAEVWATLAQYEALYGPLEGLRVQLTADQPPAPHALMRARPLTRTHRVHALPASSAGAQATSAGLLWQGPALCGSQVRTGTKPGAWRQEREERLYAARKGSQWRPCSGCLARADTSELWGG